MKKGLSALLIAVGLIFAIPVFALSPHRAAAAEEDSSLTNATGWLQDANGWFYLQNGQRLTGWLDVGGDRYYLDKDGYRVYKAQKIGKTVYVFRPETDTEKPGALYTGTSGLIQFADENNILYYLKKNGTAPTSKWVKVNGAYYYANAKGQIKLGTIRLKNKRYHITKDGRMTFYGKSAYDGKYYYAASNGVLKTGFQTINGKRYYFDKKTGARVSGTVKIGNYTYFFRNTGDAKTGWLEKANGTKIYYHDSKGRRVSGWYTINGKKYYFDPKNGNVRVQNCWKKIDGKYYRFDEKGVLQTGFFTVDGKTYYANASGVRQKGWLTVNGRKYYMNKSYVMQTGWITYNKKKFYLNPITTASTYGAASTGWVSIPNSSASKNYWYYFDNDGSMHTGWLTLDGKRYYLDADKDGRMLTGKQTIDGKTYDFGSNGVLENSIPEGAWRIEVNRASCFIVVYKGDTEMKAFVCSTAAVRDKTPTGTFYLRDKLRWHELNGPSWGQYCSHILDDILFHSVPNLKYQDNHSLDAAAYNKLGTPASGGCIRLTVAHAKYLYDNCPIGTKVIISDSVAKPKVVPIETAQKIPLTQNYDPTDPNK